MDISNEIKEYINDEESNGALLLTGKWGCGKSYLIKKLAKEINNEKEFAIIVISLFGVDSPSMLHTIIKDYYLEQTSVLLS